MKKVLLIVNPVAGKLRARSALFEIVNEFCKAGYVVTTQVTQYRGHGADLVADAEKHGFDYVVCVGGDGTLNETVTGLLRNGDKTKIKLGYIPAGSTNDFADTLGLSPIASKAAENITKVENGTWLDIGRFCGDRFFTYIASFGAFSAVSYSAPQDLKNAVGHFAYLLTGLTELGKIKAHKVSLVADGKEYSGNYIYGSVSNTTSVGGIVKFPEKMVDLKDGMFEVILVKKPSDLVELNEIVTGVMTSDYSSHMFEFFKAKDITFQMSKSVAWTLDGEKAEGNSEIHIENLAKAIKLLV